MTEEQKEFDVFAMFNTSDQANKDETAIHYEIRGSSTPKYGMAIYDSIRDEVDSDTAGLLEMARVARKIEELFGSVQNVELGIKDGEVFYRTKGYDCCGSWLPRKYKCMC